MIPIKSKQDLEMLRRSGRRLSKIMRKLQELIKPGLTTAEIDRAAEILVNQEGAIPAFKGYRGYPASVCTSINEEIIHGIPGSRILKENDILGLDLGINYKGFFTDAAVTLPMGQINPKTAKLIAVAKEALYLGIKQARAENRLFDISYTIQRHVEANGFSVVRQFVGHGIGRKLHEDPEVPNFGPLHSGPELKNGMVLAIEPMVNMGSWEALILENGWTAVTKDGLPSAHFEHTVAITESGPEILTAYV